MTEHTCVDCLHWAESPYQDMDGIEPSCERTGEVKHGSEPACVKWEDVAIAYRGSEREAVDE